MGRHFGVAGPFERSDVTVEMVGVQRRPAASEKKSPNTKYPAQKRRRNSSTKAKGDGGKTKGNGSRVKGGMVPAKVKKLEETKEDDFHWLCGPDPASG